MATVQVSITAEADDGHYQESDTTWTDRTGEGYAHGEFFNVSANTGGGDSKWGALRFNNITVPQGTTITSATLRVYNYAAPAYTDASTTIRVFGDDVDNSAALSGSHHPQSGWTNTTAYTDWEINGMSGEEEIDVTSIAQEIINRGSWSSGNSMSFNLDPEAEGSDGYFITYLADYDADTDANEIARLTIVYPDAGGDPEGPLVGGKLTRGGILFKGRLL